jgi:hypothetical protein
VRRWWRKVDVGQMVRLFGTLVRLDVVDVVSYWASKTRSHVIFAHDLMAGALNRKTDKQKTRKIDPYFDTKDLKLW